MRDISESAGLVWLYLMSSEHSNASGFYRLPTAYIVEDMGRDVAFVESALEELVEAGRVIWDAPTKMVLVRDYLDHNSPSAHGHVTHQVKLWEGGVIPREPEPMLHEFLKTWWPTLKSAGATLRTSGEELARKDPDKGWRNIAAANRVDSIQQEVEDLLSRLDTNAIGMASK